MRLWRRRKARQQVVHRGEIVAQEHDVAAGVDRGIRARDDVAGRMRAGHLEIVGEDQSAEAEPPAQDVADPDARPDTRRAPA